MTQQSGLSNLLLDQLVEGAEVGRHVLSVTLRLHWIILKSYDLGKELLVEQSQSLLAPEGYSRGQGPSTLVCNPIVPFAPSSALSSRRASGGADLHVIARNGCW